MNCIICNNPDLNEYESAKTLDYISTESINILNCRNCNLLQSDSNKISKSSTTELYNQGAYNKKENLVHKILGFYTNYLESSKLRYFRLKKGSSILEVGCGKGNFLLNCKKKNFSPYGIDLNIRVNREVIKNNIPVIESEINNLINFENFNRKYDGILIWHVLEHIENPKIFMSQLRRYIHEGSQIIIAVPNSNSLQFKLTKKYWYHLDPFRHYCHFSPKTLSSIIEQEKFSINEISYSSFYLNFIGNLISIGNLFFPIKNFPFNMIRRNKNALQGHSNLSKLFQILLYLIYLTISFIPIIIFTIIEQVLKKSGTMVFNISLKKS